MRETCVRVADRDGATFTRSDLLGRADADDLRIAQRSGGEFAVAGTDGVGGVGDQHETIPIGEHAERAHRRERPGQVHREDRPRSGCDGRRDRVGIDEAVVGDVHDDWRHPGPDHRLPRGEEGEARDDDLAAGPGQHDERRDQPVRRIRDGDDGAIA